MNTHPSDLLDEYAAGQLTASRRRRIGDHVRDCGRCDADLAAWRALAGAARETSDVPPVTDGELDRLMRRLSGAAPDPVATTRRPLVRRLVQVAAVAVLAAGIGTGIVTGFLPDGPGTAEPAAAAVLHRAAAAAAAAPAPRTADGTVWYTETQFETVHLDIAVDPASGAVVGRSFLVQQKFTNRIWLALPDRQRYDQDAAKTVVAPSDHAAWIAAGSPRFYDLPSFADDPGTLEDWQLLLDDHLVRTGAVTSRGAGLRRELDLLRTLPTNTEHLRDWLELQVRDDTPGAIAWCPTDTTSCSVEAEVFQATAALLASPIAPPKLRSALFTVLAGLRGVHLDGGTTDPTGRPATAVSITTGHLRYELYVDVDGATLLANRQVLVKPDAGADDPQWTGAAPGTVVRSVMYLKSRTVNTVGATD